MIKIKNNVISINKTRTLTKMQLRNINTFKEERTKQIYLESLLGKGRRVRINGRDENLDVRYKLEQARHPNKILHLARLIMNNDSGVNHTPHFRSKDSKFIGVEIECYIDGLTFGDCGCDDEDCCPQENEVLDDLKNALTHAKVRNCSVRYDGSLNSYGVEVCILFDANKGFGPLEKLCKVLNDFDATIDSDCGIHVHIDQKDIKDTQDLWTKGRAFESFLPILFDLQPESRRDNEYCKPIACDADRYAAINLSAYSKHKTLEVRLHAGSTNFDKIRNWIELLLAIESQYGKSTVMQKVTTIDGLFNMVKVPKSLSDFYRARHSKLNPDIEGSSTVSSDIKVDVEPVAAQSGGIVYSAYETSLHPNNQYLNEYNRRLAYSRRG